MLVQKGPQLGGIEPVYPRAAQDDNVETTDFILMEPETLPDLPLDAVADRGPLRVLLGDGQSDARVAKAVGPGKEQQVRTTYPAGAAEYALKLNRSQQPQTPRKRRLRPIRASATGLPEQSAGA